MEAIHWYNEKKGKVNGMLVPLIKFLRQNQSYRHAENLRYVRLYGNLDVLGLSSIQYSRPNPSTAQNRVTLNVIKSCVDTAQSKIAKNKVKPTFLTSGGDWSQQKKAKKLDKFILGQFSSCNIYSIAQKAFVDSCIFGTGVLKIYADEGKIKAERTIPDELIVDDAEGVYGFPKNLYQTKFVSKETLLACYPKFKTQIEQLDTVWSTSASYGPNYQVDQVIVYEAWHLPSKTGAEDGRHVIAIDGCDLGEEVWKRDTFPFPKFMWSEKPFGFWGGGISEELTGIQIEINKLLKTIQIAQHLMGSPAVYLESGSGVSAQHVNNEIGRIIKFTGTKPTQEPQGIIAPEMYAHLENLYRKAFEIVGISQLSAQAQKPSGLNSGKALREYNDIESDRFLVVGQRWETFFMDIAKQMILCARDIFEQDKDFSVKVKGKKFLDTIKWEEVDMDEDQYIMQVFPTSLLPTSPEGRLQTIQEMIQAGMIDTETGAELLDYPDLERVNDLSFASRQVTRDIVDKIVDDGEFSAPEPFIDLTYAIKYAQTAYCRAKLESCPEENLELLRRFIEQAASLAMPPAPEPAALPDMSQQLNPSDMLQAPAMPMPQEGMPLAGDQMQALPQGLPQQGLPQQ